MAQADVTQFTTGANDNASGAAALLVLARDLKKSHFNSPQYILSHLGARRSVHMGPERLLQNIKKS